MTDEPVRVQPCEQIVEEANERLKQKCAAKQFVIPTERPCAGGSREELREVQIPALRPCFELHWGDGPKDQFETDDMELLCIEASNPYANIILKNVTIILSELTHNGRPVHMLNDGTPSVSVTPTAFICFGDLPACQNGTCSQVRRELMLVSRRARPGKYAFEIAYCYSAEFTLQDRDQFNLNLEAS